jgi:protein gp37
VKDGKYWDMSINPVVGCTWASPGCHNCYAARIARRMAGNPVIPAHRRRLYQRATEGAKKGWSGFVGWDPEVIPAAIAKLSRARKPRVVFVSDMADLFHDDISEEQIDEVLAMITILPQHTFLLLTKRADRLPKHLNAAEERLCRWFGFKVPWPLPNLWLGVTVENQEQADARIPHLLRCNAAVRWVSYEPALGPVDWTCINPFDDFHTDALDTPDHSRRLSWITAGGETGPGARPAHPDWFRQTRDQCVAAGVPFYFKQWGEWIPDDHFAKLPEIQDWLNDEGQGCCITEAPGFTCIYDWGEDDCASFNPSKKAAGRALDGRTWDQMPGRGELT